MSSKGGARASRPSIKGSAAPGSAKASRASTVAPSTRKASKRPSQAARSPSPPGKRAPSALNKSDTARQETPHQVSTQATRSRGGADASNTAILLAPQPSPITVEALATINYAAFSQGTMNAKQRRARMLKDFGAAHAAGAQRIAEEWAAESAALWQDYLSTSHGPHSREIQRLVARALATEVHCQQRLQHAEAITACALHGIEDLLERLTEAGTGISAETGVLSGQRDEVLIDGDRCRPARGPGAEHGVPLPEVRGSDPLNPDPHPPAFRFAEADQREVARLKGVFQQAVDSISSRRGHGTASAPTPAALRDDGEKGGVPETAAAPSGPAAGVTTSNVTDATAAAELSDSPVNDPARARHVEELRRELDAVGEAFVALMKRVETQHGQYQQKIDAQRAALDAAATRTKLADDVLRDTVAQGTVEARSAVAEVQQLSLQLRQRMEASEAAMQAALDTLIHESAEICVDNDALQDYSALALNRENCLYGYMSRMERQVVEQADVLRHAQDSVTRLWSRLHNTQGGAAAATSTNAGDAHETALPPLYAELLQQSDRDTLLRLLCQLLQQDSAVAAHVVRGLDEHQAYCALHPEEAAAARERHLSSVATQHLLERLAVEGHLRSNTRHTTTPLSERIAHLVSQYDAYIDFNEQYARALVRQADVERREQTPSMFAFFDARTPAPGLANAPAPPPHGAVGASAGGRRQSLSAAPKVALRPAATAAPPAQAEEPSLPYLKLWEAKQRQLHEQQQQRRLSGYAAVPQSLSAAAPSTIATAGTVVGYLDRSSGAGGTVPSPPRSSSVSGGVTPAAPPGSALRGRRHTPVAATALSCGSTSPPPPPVPPRTGLTSFVLSTYGGGGGSGSGVGQRGLVYRDGDQQFIDRQRDVFQQLD